MLLPKGETKKSNLKIYLFIIISSDENGYMVDCSSQLFICGDNIR